MASTNGTGNLSLLGKHFGDENAARALLERLRWPNGIACPRCGGADPYKPTPKASGKNPARQGLYKCRACKRQLSSTTGTIFESSHVPLSKWLLAIHLLASSKKGMSAHQFHRMLGVTYRAAWFMAHRLRHAMATGDSLFTKLTGVIEADETYVGGRNKTGKGGRPGRTSHKVPVFALVQRGGKVRAFPVENVTAKTLHTALQANVDRSATLMTDEFFSYIKPGRAFAKHQTVNHGE